MSHYLQTGLRRFNNMKKNIIKTVLVILIMEIVLAALLALAIIFTVGYMDINAGVFGQMNLVGYARGYEKLWVFIYYLSDILFYLIIALLFFELILLIIRTMVTRGLKAIETIRGNDLKRIIEKVKKVSLITFFKAIKINTPKRSIIAYAIVMALVFGSGWIAKTVLNAYDSLVYRSDKIINLYSDEVLIDFANETTDADQYTILIDSDIVNIHIYSVANTVEGKFYLLYDTPEQKEAYSLDVNKETNAIVINLDQNQESYQKYIDPVLPSVELYLPSTLKVNIVDVSITTYGSLTMEYLTFNDLIIDSRNADLSIKGEGMMVDSINLTQYAGNLSLVFDNVESAHLDIEDVTATLRLNQISDDLVVDSVLSKIFLYQTTAETLTLNGDESEFELREVAGVNAVVNITNSKLLYVNTTSQNPASVTIISENSEITTKGVKND